MSENTDERDSLTTSEILDAAADSIQTNGWCQQSAYQGEKCCVFGAMKDAAGHGYTLVAEYLVLDAVGMHRSRRIFEWNDYECSSKDEAMTALREAAQLAREHGL